VTGAVAFFAALHWSGPDAVCHRYGACSGSHDSEEPNTQTVTTVSLDIAKSVFQVHGVDVAGQVVVRRQLKRRQGIAFFQKLPRCLVGIEACASSHHWSRELQGLGHSLRLMPPAYVKPYVKREKERYGRC
jgi:transposase